MQTEKRAALMAERIKSLAKKKNISMQQLLSACNLGINTISKLAKGNDILSGNLFKIAEFLDCSTDYIMGRTETEAIQSTLTEAECSLLFSYRSNPGMQPAVNKLLNVKPVAKSAHEIREINEIISRQSMDAAAFTTEKIPDFSDDIPQKI